MAGCQGTVSTPPPLPAFEQGERNQHFPSCRGNIPSQAEEGPSAKWSTFTLLKWPIFKNSLRLPQA